MDSVVYMNLVFGSVLVIALVILFLGLRQNPEDEVAESHDIAAE